MTQLFNRKNAGTVLLRIITGLLLAYHGLELFKPDTMNGYMAWDTIKALPFSKVMLYLGKGIELIAGILLALGLFTRVSAAFGAIVMLFICFFIGKGRFWYEDQHPFLFAMLCTVFVVFGSGAFALDKVIKKKL
jgi:putative oxidoreductase